MPSEQTIQRDIIRHLKTQGAFVFKTVACNVRGVPDIIACLDGRFIGIEVKRPGGKATAIQSAQIRRIGAAGGLAFVATSVKDVRHHLEQ